MRKKINCILIFSSIFLFKAKCQNQYNPYELDDSTNKIIYSENIQPFLNKLSQLKEKKGTVSILHLGDSHMQMGYFVEEMRNNFAENFGLSSIGTIFPYSIANYKPYYIYSKVLLGNWTGDNYLKSEKEFKFGVLGFTIKTYDKKAIVEIAPQRVSPEVSTGNKLILYYNCNDSSLINIKARNTLNDSAKFINYTTVFSSPDDNKLNSWKKATYYFDKPVNNFRIMIEQKDTGVPFYLYGVQLNNTEKSGIIYNNCGVGGSQFTQLCNNSSFSVSQIKDIKPDLIVFSYGSNESYSPAFRSEHYQKTIESYLIKIKEALPETSIILTSPPDTRSKDRFPINTDSITKILKNIAFNLKLSCWNLRDEMGGSGSMYKWLKLGLASKDKLHFTKEGYSLQAKLFVSAIYDAYNKSMISIENKIKLPFIIKNFK